MKEEALKRLVDACRECGRIDALMPSLPEGVTPRAVRIVDALGKLEEQGGPVLVGEVSEALGATAPSVTRALASLEGLGYVRKEHLREDRRSVAVCLTEKGRACREVYVTRYFEGLSSRLADFDERRLEDAAELMESLLAAFADSRAEVGASVEQAAVEAGLLEGGRGRS